MSAMKLQSWFFLFLFTFSLTWGFAQPTDTLRQMDLLFAAWNNATPGIAVTITRNGTPLYAKAFGLADLEHNVPNTTETIFECGSVSKQFTAAAILLLQKEGKLTITDNVRKYIPELPLYEAPITIEHLLQHTSGLKDWGVVYGLAGWPRSTRVYTQELSFDIVFRQRSLNFAPGSQYSYSNSNYVLLVQIVERVSGQSLADFTTARFFNPLGMTHTRWRDNYRDIIPDRAVAYTKADNRYLLDMPFENVHGPGGLLTTTRDLLRWNQLLVTHEILGPEMAALRIRPGKLNSGTDIQYAAGLFLGQINGVKEINHSGATAGYRAWLAWYPEKKLAVALLSNDGTLNPARLGNQIARIFLGDDASVTPREPKNFLTVTSQQAQPWEGLYKLSNGENVLRIDQKENKLSMDGRMVQLTHTDSLYLGDLRWLIRSGNTYQLITPASTQPYSKIPSPASDKKTLSAFAGTFYSEDADVSFVLSADEGSIEVYRKPGDFFTLTRIYGDLFRTDKYETVAFTRDKRGLVNGFRISLPRASNIPFRKTSTK
jgi:CubicO group peptidase (beta-lactamase class C family)